MISCKSAASQNKSTQKSRSRRSIYTDPAPAPGSDPATESDLGSSPDFTQIMIEAIEGDEKLLWRIEGMQNEAALFLTFRTGKLHLDRLLDLFREKFGRRELLHSKNPVVEALDHQGVTDAMAAIDWRELSKHFCRTHSVGDFAWRFQRDRPKGVNYHEYEGPKLKAIVPSRKLR